MSEIIEFPDQKPFTVLDLKAQILTTYFEAGIPLTPSVVEKANNLAQHIFQQRISQRVSLPFSEFSFMEQKKPPEQTKKKITKKKSRILDVAAETLETTAKDANSLVFLSKPLTQMTLPHRDPGDVLLWNRQNGRIELNIKPDAWKNPTTGKIESVGIPYGIIPRLLLIWISTEVTQTKKRRLELGASLSEFMRKLGLNPTMGGKRGDIMRLKEQMRRLFRCRISIDQLTKNGNFLTESWMDMQIA